MKTGNAIVLREQDVLRAAIRTRGTTQVEVAKKLGMLQGALSDSMSRNRVAVDKFKTILDAMDYDVYIVDRKTGEAVWALEVDGPGSET